jgi:hypothetical protein
MVLGRAGLTVASPFAVVGPVEAPSAAFAEYPEIRKTPHRVWKLVMLARYFLLHRASEREQLVRRARELQ